MGNAQSSKSPDPGTPSASSPNQEQKQTASSASSSRRDPRNLIASQRTAPLAEPSLQQARGTTLSHRTRNSVPVAHLNQPSLIQSATASTSLTNDPQAIAKQIQQSKDKRFDARDQPTKPVDVPIPASKVDSSSLRSRSLSHSVEPSGPTTLQDMSYHLSDQLQRPPRLPLPIEGDLHAPGSPIMAAADLGLDAPALDLGAADIGGLPRGISTLSNTTIDEEDAEELNIDRTKAGVPTTFEWRRGGERVYVTGSIFQWNKKQKLHTVEGQPGIFRTVITVQPGTHHVRFIVDTVMQCSQDMPTTVDFGNNLVNYIEVSADDLPRDTATYTDPIQPPAASKNEPAKPDTNAAQAAKSPKTKTVVPPSHHIGQVPQYLVDLDKAEETTSYQYAAASIKKLPSPPSLPGTLGKPILNVATPMKDDNSVLTQPNHTVINHLATSSIKSNVLAVSGTTRYKRKYVTTIMYKPTSDGSGA